MLGYEVDAINSVQFTNHTGYSTGATGQILNETDLDVLFQGIISNKFYENYSHILTGYIASVSFMEKVCEVVAKLKQLKPNIKYVCDPVLGDDGQFYVLPELMPFYRDRLIPLADIILPNQSEVQWLTGVSVNAENDAWNAIDIFHEKGVPTVVITSSNLHSYSESIVSLASCKQSNGSNVRAKIEIPKIPADFTGTGDLTAALFTAWFDLTNSNLRETLTRTMSTMKKVLDKTYKYALASGEGLTPSSLELKIIACKRDIESPERDVEAIEV